MALGTFELADRLAVPIEAEPFEPVENRIDRRLRRPLAVGVLDAQQELAAEALGVEPVEQRRARAADMQEAGRRRCEAGYDLRHDSSKWEFTVGSRALAEGEKRGKGASDRVPFSRCRDARLACRIRWRPQGCSGGKSEVWRIRSCGRQRRVVPGASQESTENHRGL